MDDKSHDYEYLNLSTKNIKTRKAANVIWIIISVIILSAILCMTYYFMNIERTYSGYFVKDNGGERVYEYLYKS